MKSNTTEKKGLGGKYFISFAVLLALIAVTAWYLLQNFEIKDLIKAFNTADFIYYILAAVLVLIFVMCEGLSYRVTISALGSHLGIFSSFVYGCVNFYFCSITPSATGGQPAVSYYMAKDDIPLSVSTFSILLHTVVYKVVLLFFGLIAVLLKSSFIAEQGIVFEILCALGFLINGFMVFGGIMSMRRPKIVKAIVNFFASLLMRLRIIKGRKRISRGITKYIGEYERGARILRKYPYLPFKVLAIDLVQRTAMFSTAYVVYRSFGLSDFSFVDLFLLQVIISLAVDSLPLPGAVGVSEAAFISLYSAVYHDAISAGLLMTRGINFYFLLVFSSIVFFVKYIFVIQKSKKKLTEK